MYSKFKNKEIFKRNKTFKSLAFSNKDPICKTKSIFLSLCHL